MIFDIFCYHRGVPCLKIVQLSWNFGNIRFSQCINRLSHSVINFRKIKFSAHPTVYACMCVYLYWSLLVCICACLRVYLCLLCDYVHIYACVWNKCLLYRRWPGMCVCVYMYICNYVYIILMYAFICGINAYFTDANPRCDLGTPADWREKFDTSDHHAEVPTTPVSRRKYIK